MKLEDLRIGQSARIISSEDWAKDWLNETVEIVGLNRRKVGSIWRDDVAVKDSDGFVYDGIKPEDIMVIEYIQEKEMIKVADEFFARHPELFEKLAQSEREEGK